MLIDWVACTIPDGSPAIIEWIKGNLPGPWIERDYALGRYTRTIKSGGISILTDAPNDESVHLIITGTGCRELEQAGLVEDWSSFIGTLLKLNSRFSRLDAALDDLGHLPFDEIIRCCQEGRVVSRYRKIIPSVELDNTTGAVIGRMVTFGKRSSDTFIRIYDKALEQGSYDPWIRIELQARDAKAQELAVSIADRGGAVVPAIILGVLDFKERGSTERRERWPTALWWTQFLGSEERFRLRTAPSSVSLKMLYDWLIRQVARIFAIVYDSGQYPTLVKDLLEIGRQKQARNPAHSTPNDGGQ